MSPQLFIGLASALLTSIVGPIAVHYVKILTEKSKEDSLSESLEVNNLIVEKLENIRNCVGSDRIWLLQFHNGGHFYPTGKSIQKFSMVYEVLSDDIVPCQAQFQNIPVSLFNKGINSLHKGSIISIPDALIHNKQFEGFTSVISGASVKSTYIFPVYNIKDDFIGIIGVDFVKSSKDLKGTQLTDLELEISTVGGVLHGYLVK